MKMPSLDPRLAPPVSIKDPTANGAPQVALPSNAPGAAGPSDPRGLRSVQPIAASVPPLRSLFPGGGTTTRAGRALQAAALATMGVGAIAVAVIGMRHGGRTKHGPLVTQIASGSPGVRTTPSGAEERWLGSSPPAFVLDPSLDTISADAKGAIVDAFATWDGTNIGLPKATFTISSTAGVAAQDGVSRIVYAPITVKGFEEALAITIAYADANSGQIEEEDMIINTKYSFSVLPSGTSTLSPTSVTGSVTGGGSTTSTCTDHYDVQDVITHEVGHVYGLGEDYTGTTATMYYTSQPCETHKRVLSASDLTAMTSLYAPVKAQNIADANSSASSGSTGCGAATVASESPGSGSFGWGVGAIVALAVARRTRRGRRTA